MHFTLYKQKTLYSMYRYIQTVPATSTVRGIFVCNRKNVQTGGDTAQYHADVTVRNIVDHYCMITT